MRHRCSNATPNGLRYIVGGSAGEPRYMYGHVMAQGPFRRYLTNGFRCAQYIDPAGEELLGPVELKDEIIERVPATDEVFEAYLAMYDYDRVEPEASVDAVDEDSPHWVKETVSYDAAYGGERITTYVFPRNAEPPFQAVLWYPGNDVLTSRSSENLVSAYLWDFIPRSGRALVYPVYKGTYERAAPLSRSPNDFRDMMVYWSKDLRRTVDYLETRDDIDSGKLAYYGFSSGAIYGPLLTAIDQRFQASVLLASGLFPIMSQRPETDLVNFAPRSQVPTIMISGRDDFLLPYEASQLPLFRLLGAPDADKRLARLEGGHIPSDRLEIVRETLDWLDRYLGSVGAAPDSTRTL
jgi:predicted esterase